MGPCLLRGTNACWYCRAVLPPISVHPHPHRPLCSSLHPELVCRPAHPLSQVSKTGYKCVSSHLSSCSRTPPGPLHLGSPSCPTQGPGDAPLSPQGPISFVHPLPLSGTDTSLPADLPTKVVPGPLPLLLSPRALAGVSPSCALPSPVPARPAPRPCALHSPGSLSQSVRAASYPTLDGSFHRTIPFDICKTLWGWVGGPLNPI